MRPRRRRRSWLQVDSRLTGDAAVVTPTLNPLVALYAPRAGTGHPVRFRPRAVPPRRVDEHQYLALRARPERNFVVAGCSPHHLRDGPRRPHEKTHRPLFTTGTPRDAEHSALHRPSSARSGCRSSS